MDPNDSRTASSDTGQPKQSLAILLINQTWFAEELKALGHRVITLGWDTKGRFDINLTNPGQPLSEVFPLLPIGFRPERIVYYDNSGPVGITGLVEIDIPTIFYSVDCHHHSSWHSIFGAAFDCVLVAQKDFLSLYKRYNSNVEWLPLWAPHEYQPNSERSVPVSFRGNLNPKLHPNRAVFFNELQKSVPIDIRVGPYEEIYAKSKIVLNQAVKGDLNFRVFEAMMSGALLITPELQNGFSDLFEDGVNLVTYPDGDVEDAAKKIQYYLCHEGERAHIAERGRELILKKHTATGRALQLEAVLLKVRTKLTARKHYGLGLAHLVAGKLCVKENTILRERFYRLAEHCFSKAVQVNEDNEDAFLSVLSNYVVTCWNSNESVRSIEFLKELYKNNPDKRYIAGLLIHIYLQIGRTEDAGAMARELSVNPEQLLGEIRKRAQTFDDLNQNNGLDSSQS